jgi:hypothetical protein
MPCSQTPPWDRAVFQKFAIGRSRNGTVPDFTYAAGLQGLGGFFLRSYRRRIEV